MKQWDELYVSLYSYNRQNDFFRDIYIYTYIDNVIIAAENKNHSVPGTNIYVMSMVDNNKK